FGRQLVVGRVYVTPGRLRILSIGIGGYEDEYIAHIGAGRGPSDGPLTIVSWSAVLDKLDARIGSTALTALCRSIVAKHILTLPPSKITRLTTGRTARKTRSHLEAVKPGNRIRYRDAQHLLLSRRIRKVIRKLDLDLPAAAVDGPLVTPRTYARRRIIPRRTSVSLVRSGFEAMNQCSSTQRESAPECEDAISPFHSSTVHSSF